jgi:hypothetical protein
MRCSVVAVALMLASCSSGGGGGGGGSQPPPEPPPSADVLPITAENAPEVTAAVLGSIISTTDLVGVVDVIGLPAIGSANPALTGAVQKAVRVETMACDTGRFTMTWNDEDEDFQLSTGDSLEVAFDACQFVDAATTVDGVAAVTGIVMTGDPLNAIPPWSLEARFGFDSMRSTDSDGTVIVDGALDLAMRSEDNLTIRLTIRTNTLSSAANGMTEALSDFAMTQVLDVNTLMMSIVADGVLTSSRLDGSVTFETLEPFMAAVDGNPHSGQMRIAERTSSVLVTVIDNVNVELQVDENLDGLIDATQVTTWASLGFE